MDIKRRFGKALKEKRTGLGLSQEELGMRVGADQAYISRIEAGQMNVTIETAEQLAQAVHADVGELFAGKE